MKSKLRNLSASHLALLAILSTSPALLRAQSVWDGGGTPVSGLYNWSDANNWAGDVAPVSGTTTIVQLAGSVGTTSNIDTPFSVQSLTFNSGASAFTLSGSTLSIRGTGSDVAAITVSSTSSQTIQNNISMLATFAIVPTSGDLILNGGLAMNGFGVRFNPAANRTLTLNGVISGAAGTTAFNGSGKTNINAANSFTTSVVYLWSTGTVQVNTNSLLGSNGAFGAGASTVVQLGSVGGAVMSPTLVTGTAATVGQNIQLANPVSGSPTYTIGGNSAHISSYTGTIFTNISGTTARALTLTAATGGRVNVSNIRQSAGTGATAGTGDNVTKTGNGIVNLATGGTFAYAGTTTVSAGTLLVNGTLTSTALSSASVGAVTVNANAVLGGLGNVNRATTFAGDATLAPGDINAGGTDLGGTLSFGAGLTLSNTTNLRFDLATPTSLTDDMVAVVGNFTLDGVLNITDLGGFGVGTYTLFTYSGGTFTDNGLTIGTAPGGFDYEIDTATSGSVNLIVTVPEPAATLLVGLGTVAMVFRRRSRLTHP